MSDIKANNMFVDKYSRPLRANAERYLRKERKTAYSRSRKDAKRSATSGNSGVGTEASSYGHWNNREEIYTNVYGSNLLKPDRSFLKTLSSRSGQGQLM